MAALEITCTACGAETLVRREAKYDGFTKIGEVFICTACGHVYEDEADVPFRTRKTAAVFTDADRSRALDIFADDEKGRNCRHCKHYVVNPFTQRCGLHEKEVNATDLCFDFEEETKTEEKAE